MATEQEWYEDRLRFALGRPGSDTDGAGVTGPLTGEFVRLAEALAGETTVHGVLRRVVEVAQHAVPGADLVSITLRSPAGYTTPVETDPLATRLDELQYRLDEGRPGPAPRVPAVRPGGRSPRRAQRARRRDVPARW